MSMHYSMIRTTGDVFDLPISKVSDRISDVLKPWYKQQTSL